MSKDGVFGKANTLRGAQINRCGSEGRCVGQSGRLSGNEQGPQNASLAEGFILRTEVICEAGVGGALKGNDRVRVGAGYEAWAGVEEKQSQ